MSETGKAVETSIHPTAIVEPGAQLGHGVTIGPFSHIGPDVVIGDGVEIMSHVTVMNATTIGRGCRIFPQAILGGEPQNNAYKGERTTLTIGEHTLIREGVTMHTGTGNSRGETVVGSHCSFLAYTHVAHDCIVGDHVTFANNAMIGGHVVIEHHAILGGGCAVQQFCTVGHHAFVGGITPAVKDVIPYGMVVGSRCYLKGLNLVGLRRSGLPRDAIHAVRSAYRMLFENVRGTLLERCDSVIAQHGEHEAVRDIIEFIRANGGRKLIVPLEMQANTDQDG